MHERLAAAPIYALVVRQHAAYYLALIARADQAIIGPTQVQWLDRLEHDNIRAMLECCIANPALS